MWEVGARSFSGTRSALERVVEADGEDLILAGVDLATRECDAKGRLSSVGTDGLLVIAVAGDHIGEVQLGFLREVQADAETVGSGAHVEVDVALISIAHPLARDLHTAADVEPVEGVPFEAEEVFVRVALEGLLLRTASSPR